MRNALLSPTKVPNKHSEIFVSQSYLVTNLSTKIILLFGSVNKPLIKIIDLDKIIWEVIEITIYCEFSSIQIVFININSDSQYVIT